jgi:sterol 14-demethylase
MMMVSAAHVNTAATFAWTLLHLLRNPRHFATFREEIASNPPSDEGIYPWREMPFSEACLRETGRLYTNLLMLRLLPQDIVVEGIVIPKGWLAISPLATQQDPTVYENPEQWDPTRWLASPDSYTSKFRNSEFVQFGAGAHACLGEKFTHSLLRGVLWPALFDAYDLVLVHGIEDGEGIDGVGVAPNYRENMGTPLGVREIGLRVTRRKERLSDSARDEARYGIERPIA